MVSRIEVETIDTVPGDSRVVHYDELEPDTKARFVELARDGSCAVRDDVCRAFEDYDVVKFTDYYRIATN